MFGEIPNQESRVLSTAERASRVFRETIDKGDTCWVPFHRYIGNVCNPAGDESFTVEWSVRSRGDVNVYVLAEIADIYHDIDDNGKPIVIVTFKVTDYTYLAIEEGNRPGLHPGFLNRDDGYRNWAISYYPELPIGDDYVGLKVAPDSIRTNREVLTCFSQDVRIVYYYEY